jgi:hypothetical protein
MTESSSVTIKHNKKVQIRNSFIKEIDDAFKIFQTVEDGVELQSVYNIFSILKTTNPELLIKPFYEDFAKDFFNKIVPEIDVDFFLTYNIGEHIRKSVTTKHIHDAMIAFSNKTQIKLNSIHNSGSDADKEIVADLGKILQKVVKLSNLYNK